MKLITLTNDGYIEYTQNLVNSLNNVGINNIEIFAVGKKSYNHFTKQNIQTNLLSSNFFSNVNKFQEWRSRNFNKLMFIKLSIIYESLLQNEKVLFTDGDIVFLKNPIKEIDAMPIKDMIGQYDYNPSEKNKTLCAGFMLVKNTENSLNLFNPSNVPKDLLDLNPKNNDHFDDQRYINQNLKSIDFNYFDIDKYPNGLYYYNNFKSLDPSIIHFNYIVGSEKKNKMQQMGYWYL